MKRMKTHAALCTIFLSALLLSADVLVAESGSFLMIWRYGGPFRVKLTLGGGAARLSMTQTAAVADWPDFAQVVWPATETRPAPAQGEIQGLVFLNNFDPATQTRDHDQMLTHFRECARVAMIAAARPGKYYLEVLVSMSDTSQAWSPWGNWDVVWSVSMAPDTMLSCTLRTNA